MDLVLGHEGRSSLPEDFVRFMDRQSAGKLLAITWIEPHRHRFTAHFEKDRQHFEQRIFRYRAACDQSAGFQSGDRQSLSTINL